jgi:hypothetical protein
MIRTSAVAAVLVGAALLRPAGAEEEYAKRAPYPAIRWEGEAPEVSLDGEWHALLAIDGVEAERIVAFARRTWGDLWRKRFEEDLVEVLSRMGNAAGDAVALSLRNLETGETTTRSRVPMTEANRRAIRDAARAARRGGGGSPSAAVRRVSRPHADGAAGPYARLGEGVRASGPADARTISRAQAQEDLDELEWLVESRFAYRDRLGVDVAAAFDGVRGGLTERIGVGSFALRLGALLAAFGDGHGGVEGLDRFFEPGFTPFLASDAAGGLVAFRADRSGLLDAGRPFLVAIDGVPVERWVETSARWVAQASPTFVRRRSVRGLRAVQHLRRAMGLPEMESLTVDLAAAGGKDRRTLSLRVADRPPAYGTWPRTASRMLADRVGYLRVEEMQGDPGFLARLDETLDSMRDARALVVDVRGNGGGSRDALRTILPRFLADGDAAVVNVAAYRLDEGDDPEAPEGHLSDRFLFPEASSRWGPLEAAAIGRARKAFRPEWTPPAGKFSAWHWMVVSPALPPGVPRFRNPVVVLQDSGCFSATDVFLGAMKGRDRVTLLGGTSSGGSGRARRFALAHSGIAVRLSSMASFRADGALYDGRGIEPDVAVQPAPQDLCGPTDAVLAAALERLRVK